MGKLLQFERKTAAPTIPPPVSEEQLYAVHRKRTIAAVRELTAYYQSTGAWTDECEPHVIQAIQELSAVCAILAKVGNNGTPNVG